jgi:polyhydroxyalkanoate synthesis regulator protein
MSEQRKIKKYNNRKFYDPSISDYVTLDQMGDMVSCGDDILVVDSSEKDITAVTLCQILTVIVKKQGLAPTSSVTGELKRIVGVIKYPV